MLSVAGGIILALLVLLSLPFLLRVFGRLAIAAAIIVALALLYFLVTWEMLMLGGVVAAACGVAYLLGEWIHERQRQRRKQKWGNAVR